MWLVLILRNKTDVEISHFTLAKIRAAAGWFSYCSTGLFPTKEELAFLHKKIKLVKLSEVTGKCKE